ncbi:MAG: hypothetical protein MRJ65_06350 [Candidatus Brocadiaceae bacterium]|nr:hypothetical protein [Candidatus Brocadiaceae bacterium]
MLQKLSLKKISAFITGVIAALCVFVSVSHAGEKKAAFDPKSVVFVTNRDSSDVTIIDMNTDTVIDRIACGDWGNPHMSVPTDDGQYLVSTCSQGNYVAVINLKTREVSRVRLDVMPEHFCVSADNELAYIGNMGGGSVSVLDIKAKKEITNIPGFFEPHGLVCSADGSKVYIANMGAHEVGVIDTKTLQLVKRIEIGSADMLAMVNRIDMNNKLSEVVGSANPTLTLDGKYAYVADGDSNQVAVINTANDEIIATIPVGDEPWRAYASPDGTKMVVPNNGDHTISVIDVKTNKVIATFRGDEDMTGVNFLHNGKKAYVISRGDSALRVINLEKMKEVKRIKLPEGSSLETASTTPDGKKVYLAASRRNSVYVFDGTTDRYKEIPNVGYSPWAVSIIGGANYCH